MAKILERFYLFYSLNLYLTSLQKNCFFRQESLPRAYIVYKLYKFKLTLELSIFVFNILSNIVNFRKKSYLIDRISEPLNGETL